jgi:hypothetical protein
MKDQEKKQRKKKGNVVPSITAGANIFDRLIKEAKQQENALKKKQAAGDDKVNQAQREKLSKMRAEEEDRQRTSAANILSPYDEIINLIY